MTPYLVTAPTAGPVTLNEVKAHLRVVHGEDDTDIEERVASAVAHLDGWGGALGRCIMPQTWAVDVEGPGPHVLPFPEADTVVVTGVSGVLAAEVTRCAIGPMVTISDAMADEAIVIQFESALPATRLPAAKSLIKLMVQRDFDMLAGSEAMAMDHAIAALINNLRWRRV